MRFSKGPLLALTATMLTAPAAWAQDNVMIVFDGSNSMWGQIDGTAKIEIARDVMGNLLGDWAEDRTVGLMAYGHRTRGDCTDIEVIVEPGAAQRGTILDRINAITPTGKTPLTDAVEQAATGLSYTDRPATVVLISDGLESCQRDPCELARTLEQRGVNFTAHVVGFGLGADEDTASLACIAEETGGQYIQASNADELGAALSAVATAVAVPEPEPEPEPRVPQVTVDAPASAMGGSDITVTWSPTVAERDYIYIVPPGAESKITPPYELIGDRTEVILPAPGKEGPYEVRYFNQETKTDLGLDTLTVVKPEVTLAAPDTAQTGAQVKITWSPTINKRDYITIVPAGAETGSLGDYGAINKRTDMTHTAPADPGLYEVRYVLHQDKSTVASRPLEVTNPQVVLQTPETALTGADIPVSWTGTVNKADYIAIVPLGADEGTYGNYIIVRDDSTARLLALADPGMHEIRYIQREGNKTLARATIELLDPEVTITGPNLAVTGAQVTVGWTGTVNKNDYITVVPAGAAPDTYGDYKQARDDANAKLTMPSDPGMYELRYVLREGPRVLAAHPIEIANPEVSVSGPATAATGSDIPVTWTGTVNGADYVTIVPVGAEPNVYGSYQQVRDRTEVRLTAPSDPGMYELRYVLREGPKVMATAMIEITEPQVTISGPNTAPIGSRVDVAWTGTVNGADYITVVPVGAEPNTYGNYQQTRDKAQVTLTMPADPGMYELRYVLREGPKVMATAMIELTMPEVSVSTAEQVRAGDALTVEWSDTVNPNDYMTLVPMGSEDNKYGEYFQVRDKASGKLTAPEETGLYELRYVLREGPRVLARQTVEVLARDAALNTGGALNAPETGAPGSTIDVTWQVGSTSADQRITLARGNQAIFTWLQAVKITDGAASVRMTLPQEPGVYELRFLDVAGQAVLARKVITVE